ncbi:MAG: SOS response-associated peptidase family protein [Gammaproteobacteria bacterium]
MCGRFNIVDSPAVHELCHLLDIDINNWPIRFSDDITPTNLISIIREESGQRRIDNAIWWLLLEYTETGWSPNSRYATFNTRHDKLNNPRSVGYKAYRESRCIIPASCFVEGLKGTKKYFLLEPVDHSLAFGGLYRTWLDEKTGELAYSASIITLPPHPKLKGIHDKSSPLILDINNHKLVNNWLSGEIQTISLFDPILIPKLKTKLKVTPIDRPSKKNPIGETFMIDAD